jgi:TolB-like protein
MRRPLGAHQTQAHGAGGEPVSRNALFDAVWPGGVVSDDTLTRCIVELRKAFDDTARESRVIETIPKMGFRLVLPVEPLTAKPPDTIQASLLSPAPHRGTPAKRRQTGLLAIAALLLLGLVLFWQGPRSWLGEPLKAPGPEGADYLPKQQPGIAVLPFLNMSNDPENAYFSDGISEELLNTLSHSNRFPVIARTSSFRFKDQNRDITEIGRMLGVTHILEGSVRRSGGEVRVTAQLIDATSGRHLWSDAYQREMRDIFALQQAITRDIVDQIVLALGESFAAEPGVQPAATGPTHNPDAYNLYLKGMQLLSSSNPVPREQAVAYFDRAIALDSDYADAWAGKGRALYELARPSFGHSHIPATVYPEAIAAFRRALEIEPRHAFALGWLGICLLRNDFMWTEGMDLLRQSITLNPNDASLLGNYGIYLDRMNMEGSEAILKRAFRLDPYGLRPITIRAISLFRNSRSLDSLRIMETSLIGDPDGYAPNAYTAGFTLRTLGAGSLDKVEDYIHKARQVAHPVDLCLDMLQWSVDAIRGTGPIPWEEIWQRAPTEHACHLAEYALLSGLEGEQAVRAFDLMIEQRDYPVAGFLFGPRRPQIPEADWQRMREQTGITRFLSRR